MKIICNREQLARMFSAVASVAPPKSPKEVLSTIKFVAKDGELVLHATDMEIWMSAPVSGVEVQRDGKALLPVGRTGQMLAEMSDETITIEVVDTTIFVKGAHSEFKLPSANPDEYPSIKSFDASEYHSITARVFAEAIKRTEWATDPDSSRFALGGVLCVLESDSCAMVGTDGRRLALCKFGGESVNGHKSWQSSIIPVRAAKIIQRALADGDELCKVALTTTEVSVLYKGIMIGARLVEGRYPNWQQVIPKRDADWNRVEVACGPLNGVVGQASIVADKETRGLDFTFGNNNLIVGAQAAELGQSTIEMPIEWEADLTRVKLDFRFVRDFLKVLKFDEKVAIDLRSGTMPVVFSVENYEYVCMPMALD